MYAHSPNDAGTWQELDEHLRAVAAAAADFAAPFGGAAAVELAGLAHDIGKAGAWQEYLARCAAEPNRKHQSRDHKGAGALVLADLPATGLLALLVQGHHGGLHDKSELKGWLRDRDRDDRRLATAWATNVGLLPLSPSDPAVLYPAHVRTDPLACELWLRMCFSALVDADFRDTERHFTPASAARRGQGLPLAILRDRLAAHVAALSGHRDDPVNRVRAEVYHACLAAAAAPPGLFRLTVPTGGGKTLSGLSFALDHALTHGQARVIVAVPYLTITDQTADVYRRALGDEQAVLEHYSTAGAVGDDASGDPTPREVWRRLAAEDWDAPVIVTTTVQLFESLFANGTSKCRKLHRLANAVIILDEVQSLPVRLLTPMLDVLAELVAHYGTTVVLSTATQPAFAQAPGFADRLGPAREIAPDPARLFQTLRRVDYEWPAPDETWDWERVAAEVRHTDQALAIVNTKRDALALLDALADPAALHLSTSLCAAHRREVLAVIRHRLDTGSPCRVVSTQVVEAGVDLDFPVVFRALGPLDSIVQAAGRCNREGRRERGRVVVFAPTEGGMPPGSYKTAATVTEHLLAGEPPDPHTPELFERYFASLYGLNDLDAKRIQPLRRNFAYEQVARAFRLIDDDTVSVVVPYDGLPPSRAGDPRSGIEHAQIRDGLVKQLLPSAPPLRGRALRAVLTRLQPYTVAVRRRELPRLQSLGYLTELAGELWEWQRRYDPVQGLSEAADEAMFIA